VVDIMTKRKTRGGPKRPPRSNAANGRNPPTEKFGDYLEQIEMEVEMSSGYVVIVRRPPFNLIQSVGERGQAKYPDPEVPTESVVLDEGTPDETVKEIHLMKGTPEHDAYLKEVLVVAQKRNAYILDYIFRRRLEVKDYEGAEGHAELVARHKDDLLELREWGNVDDDLDDYQLVMRYFVVYTMNDHNLISGICSGMTEAMDIKPEEILRRARSFQSPVEQHADPGA